MTVAVRVNVRLAEISKETQIRASAAVRKAAFDIEAHAKARAPVDTGFLRSAIQAESETGTTLAWTVTSYASYSVYLEYGTRHMAAQPYMTPAAELVTPEFRKAMASLV